VEWQLFLEHFEKIVDLELDRFQEEALAAIDHGESVLVAAPTGSGKTIVGLYGAKVTTDKGLRAFYTTPLKALSNQKYHEFCRFFGPERVGLLTGDNTINPDAPVVIMTTEVLRNMIYAEGARLTSLGLVVLDEVHYLQNPYRGAVWEEVIIHLPRSVKLVCLSATVSNVDEFAGWLRTVRGQMTVVVAKSRAVPLEHFYLFTTRGSGEVSAIPMLLDGIPNAHGPDLDPPWLSRSRRNRQAVRTPSRPEMVEYLAGAGQLPAIVFVFSRVGCEAAVQEVLWSGLRLTSATDRIAIRQLIDDRLEELSRDDLNAVGYGEFVAALEAGIAFHHAGMIPPFREIVEAAFERSLVKVVFATETLSLGINMPAKAVVIERLVKFNGESHQLLSPGEYTQFSGRAGRRGIDDKGVSYVCWGPAVSFNQAAEVVKGDFYPITSSFRPTYNMAANLVRRYRPEFAKEVLNLSFAQYMKDAEVVEVEARLRRLASERKHREKSDVARVSPGAILAVPGRGKGANAKANLVVVSIANRSKGELRIKAISPNGKQYVLANAHLSGAKVIGAVSLPRIDRAKKHSYRHEAARILKRSLGARHYPEPSSEYLGQIEQVSDAVERERLKARLATTSQTLYEQFQRVMKILEIYGFVDGWSLTAAGERLSQLYSESDLALALLTDQLTNSGLGVGELVAVLSWFTFEPRPSFKGERLLPPRLDDVYDHAVKITTRLRSLEHQMGLPLTRELEIGFSRLAYKWSTGASLKDTLKHSDLPPGDFIRNVKQIADLTRQIEGIYRGEELGRLAAGAKAAIVRGVVALSSEIKQEAYTDEILRDVDLI
jgi:ATP-dependent RNA helicase HelY